MFAASWDLGADLSFDSNPNGVWTYGYSTSPSLAPECFRPCAVADAGEPIGFWHASDLTPGSAGYYPYIAANRTERTWADPTASWAVRPREVAMEASNDGRFAIVRFVAPRAGTYRVKARFAGIHFRLSSTDVHVLRGATSVFDAEIAGYGGAPAFHAFTGAGATSTYSGHVVLAAGQSLAVAVGYGRNRTHYNDTTGVLLRIRTSDARDR